MASRSLVCVPLECERRALLGKLDGSVVLRRTGYGPAASARAVRGLATAGFDVMVVAGLAGGLSDEVRSGDVVVASEIIRAEGTVRRCRSAPLLAGELRRHGLAVHCGPILSTDHVVRGAERDTLSRSAALAVDMESAALSPLAEDRPLAVVRVVVDTRCAPFLDVATIGRGLRALRGLRAAAPALVQWVRAAGDRRVLLAPRRARSGRSVAHGVPERVDVVVRDAGSPTRADPDAAGDGVPTYRVGEAGDVRLDWLRAGPMRISAATSAPAPWVEELVGVLRGLGRVDVEDRRTKENIRFGCPKEVS